MRYQYKPSQEDKPAALQEALSNWAMGILLVSVIAFAVWALA